MLFNSYVFILAFLPCVALGYYGLNKLGRFTVSKAFLLIASLFFYGYFNWSYLPIIILSIVFNYLMSSVMLGARVETKRKCMKKFCLILSIVANIGCLFFFKYFDFFASNINSVFGTSFSFLNLILPLGISFFTFQQVSYVVDSYKGTVPKYSFIDYSLFVTFFPQLIAGPIVLHSEIVPQFADKSNRSFNSDNFAKGIYGFVIGLAKKVLIADTFGVAVNWAFGNVEGLGTVNAFIIMLSYTFQIYFDFSGYCDMATGIGLMFNIKIPMNFNSPYKAVDILDFWKRWHITLTRFFTTYVYIPLGGNKKGKLRTYINVLIVFLISGLWHGANWTFIVWGALHGAMSVFTRMFYKQLEKLSKIIRWAATFLFVNLAWVIFRADSLGQALDFFKQLGNWTGRKIALDIRSAFQFPEFKLILSKIPIGGGYIVEYLVLFFLLFAFVYSVFLKNTNERIDAFKPNKKRALATPAIFVWCIMSLSGVSTFLYWNF